MGECVRQHCKALWLNKRDKNAIIYHLMTLTGAAGMIKGSHGDGPNPKKTSFGDPPEKHTVLCKRAVICRFALGGRAGDGL